MVHGMTGSARAFALVTLLAATATAGHAQDGCMAEYKAKRDTPFELHYETAPINGACTQANARAELQQALAARGLVLLKVLSVKET